MKIYLKNGETIAVTRQIAAQIESSMYEREEKNWVKIVADPEKRLIIAIDLTEVIAIS